MPASQRVRRILDRVSPPASRQALRSAAALALAISLAAGLFIFLGRRTPFKNWLALPLGTILGCQLVLNLAWVSAGFAITSRLLPRSLPRLDRLAVSVPAGVTAFFVALYALGALHLFRWIPALVLALIFIASGLPALLRFWQEGRAASADDGGAPPLRGLALAALIMGVLGVGLIYLGAFSPISLNFDATWIHLTVPEVLAREGRWVPFSGDWQRELPLLASVLQVWSFLVPSLPHPAAHWMMALHTEFALFLWTLVGVAATVNCLIETRPVRSGWAAFMLFPGIFVYDGNLGGAADHVAAFFLPALLLLTLRAKLLTAPRSFALWGALAAAALMAKYQALYAVLPLGTLLVAGVLLDRGRQPPEQRLSLARAAAFLGGAFLLVVAPPFLKNLIFHGNPFYPLLQDVFPSHPTVKDGALFVQQIMADHNWRAPAELDKRISEALGLMFSFAFEPHYSFVGNIPIFGFAFTLSLPFLLVIPRAGRLAGAAAVGMCALFLWGFTYRVDRNLQVFMPLLAATAGAILIRAWRLGAPAKAGVAVLVAAQLVWASDLYFTGQDQIKDAILLINSGRQGHALTRFDSYFPDHFALDRALPKDAVLLVHQTDPELGFPRRSYKDQVGFEGVIDYRTYATPRDFYLRLRQLGITHVVHVPSGQQTPYLAEEAIFNSFLASAPGPKTRIGAFETFPMPPVPPPPRAPLQVLTLGGAGGYPDGLYPVTSLDYCFALPAELQHRRAPAVPASAGMAAALAERADVVLVGAGTPDPATSRLLAQRFRAVNTYGGLVVYVRTVPAP